MKFKIKFYGNDEDPAWETEPVDFNDLLYDPDYIEFEDVKGEWSLPYKDFRFDYYAGDGKHEVILLDE